MPVEGGVIMERLTIKNWRNLDPWETCGQDNYCKRGCHEQGGCTKGCIVPRIYARLAAYEDTGLEPEEIYEVRFLIAAQRDPQKLARLRELVLADQDGRLHITPAFVWHNGDSGLHEVPYKPWMAQWIATGTKFWLTREEAEAALKGGGG